MFRELLDEQQEKLDKAMTNALKAWIKDNIQKYTSVPLVRMRSGTVRGDKTMIDLLKSPIKQIAIDLKKLGMPNKYAKSKYIIEAFEEMGYVFKKQSTLKNGKHTVFNGFYLGENVQNEVIPIGEVK